MRAFQELIPAHPAWERPSSVCGWRSAVRVGRRLRPWRARPGAAA